MRTLTTFAKEKSLILLFAATIFFSCGKNSSSVGHVDPPATPKPTVSAPVPPTGWYDGNITGNFSITSGTEYTVSVSTDNGTSVTVSGNTYTLSNVKAPTRVTITATNKGGQTSASVDVPVYSEVVTNFSIPLEGVGPWRRTHTYYSTDSVVWVLSTSEACGAPVEFRPDFTCYLFATECGSPADHQNAPWSYSNGFVTWVSKTQQISSLSKREFVGIRRTETTSTFWLKEVWKR